MAKKSAGLNRRTYRQQIDRSCRTRPSPIVTVGRGEQATRERTLKIAIMGSGGIGGYYGARLQQGGADVTFIARGEQLKAFRQNGIALEGDRPIHLPTVKATDDPATIGKVDMVIFSVKLRDTEAAAKQILPLIGPDTGIISLQNGVTKDGMLAPIVGRQHLLGGAAYIAVSIARPGVIKKAGTNERLSIMRPLLGGSRPNRCRSQPR